MKRVTTARIADGMYRVEHDGRNEIVYIAGSAADRWIFWNGRVLRGDLRAADITPRRRSSIAVGQSLTAPMPARVVTVLTKPGATVKKGDTLIVLEAMKMELPVRSLADATIVAVHCHEGQLVDADAVLIELM